MTKKLPEAMRTTSIDMEGHKLRGLEERGCSRNSVSNLTRIIEPGERDGTSKGDQQIATESRDVSKDDKINVRGDKN